MIVEQGGNWSVHQAGNMVYSYEVAETPREFHAKEHKDSLNWTSQTDYIGDFHIFPYGDRNDMPDQIKKVVFNNSLAPGILNKAAGLLWGTGPKLYQEKIVGNQVVREWQEDDEIEDWLKSWDCESYLLKGNNDYQAMQGFYTRYELNAGSLLNNNFIYALHHEQHDKARLARLRTAKEGKATHVVLSDWSFAGPQSFDYKAYNIFDFRKPFAYPNAIMYSNLYSFCSDYYTIPALYGTMEWIRRSTAIPYILKSLSKHSINLKYHLVSPAEFWNRKEKEIQENCIQAQVTYEKKMLKAYESEVLKQISEVFSGEENTGKFWHTVKELIVDNMNLLEQGWEIKVIDQKVKDFIDSQISIADRADRAVSAAANVHGALGNVSDKNVTGSGSEQLYALKNYMATGISIPEMIVCKPVNYALMANFKTKLKLGFFHLQPEKEQNVNPEDRMKNSQPS
ncbi:hypothetical protein ACLI1A_10130 [Flavobacterium sp. RHBU_3]|uniref:hypothetical protein n=1 Tax=Flavobacterium sp. RHBU_3 TaxID=3391184 RepID=UPI003984D03C